MTRLFCKYLCILSSVAIDQIYKNILIYAVAAVLVVGAQSYRGWSLK